MLIKLILGHEQAKSLYRSVLVLESGEITSLFLLRSLDTPSQTQSLQLGTVSDNFQLSVVISFVVVFTATIIVQLFSRFFLQNGRFNISQKCVCQSVIFGSLTLKNTNYVILGGNLIFKEIRLEPVMLNFLAKSKNLRNRISEEPIYKRGKVLEKAAGNRYLQFPDTK